MTLSRILITTTALSLLAACGDRPSQQTPVTVSSPTAMPATAAAPDAPAAVATAPGAADTAPSCTKYAEALCDALGTQEETCGAVRITTGLMPPAACDAGLKDLAYSKGRIAKLGEACTNLGQKLCADLGKDSETCAMVQTQVKTFPAERCSTMMSQYPQVLAELERMEAANKPLSAELQTAIAGGTVADFGPKDAKVTLVEFSDFECPYCAGAADALSQVKKAHGDKVRIVFRQFPLSFHSKAHLAAQASLEARAQGKFWPFHDLLFANQDKLDRASLEGFAETAGLDLGKFKAALDAGTHAAAVDADLKLGEKVGVSGTPSMFVNGQRVSNPADFATISALIQAEQSK
ncbi:MAG: protein-disulfide isomerase [Myxococcota bacterium]|jgi:protein-disulfide isomerase